MMVHLEKSVFGRTSMRALGDQIHQNYKSNNTGKSSNISKPKSHSLVLVPIVLVLLHIFLIQSEINVQIFGSNEQ